MYPSDLPTVGHDPNLERERWAPILPPIPVIPIAPIREFNLAGAIERYNQRVMMRYPR